MMITMPAHNPAENAFHSVDAGGQEITSTLWTWLIYLPRWCHMKRLVVTFTDNDHLHPGVTWTQGKGDEVVINSRGWVSVCARRFDYLRASPFLLKKPAALPSPNNIMILEISAILVFELRKRKMFGIQKTKQVRILRICRIWISGGKSWQKAIWNHSTKTTQGRLISRREKQESTAGPPVLGTVRETEDGKNTRPSKRT